MQISKVRHLKMKVQMTQILRWEISFSHKIKQILMNPMKIRGKGALFWGVWFNLFIHFQLHRVAKTAIAKKSFSKWITSAVGAAQSVQSKVDVWTQTKLWIKWNRWQKGATQSTEEGSRHREGGKSKLRCVFVCLLVYCSTVDDLGCSSSPQATELFLRAVHEEQEGAFYEGT